MAHILAPAAAPATELGRYRILSSTAGVRVSPLQLGAMSLGQAWEPELGPMDKAGAFKLLDEYVLSGGNFIDTANDYQDEESEEWLGEYFDEKGTRDQMVIATKYTTHYRKHDLGLAGINYAGNHRKSLRLSVEASLKKLRTSYIDILYLHWWDHTTSIEEIMDSLHILVEQGKILYLGMSDTPAWIVSAANYYARANNKTPISIYQGRWNVMMRDFEREIIPMARHFGMALAPWGALGSGKFQSSKAIQERKQRGEALRSIQGGEQSEAEAKMSEALCNVAAEHGIKSPTAVALAYVMSKYPYTYPIVGGRKVEHLRDNVKCLHISLTQQQIEYLEAVVPFDPGFPSNLIGPDPKVAGKATGLLAASGNLNFAIAK
ncbi:putative aryl-alcohol dehydrogenase Aad14 [Lasiosphaeria miniovina]|uniref:Aryl-alcohol dehydrogenase Aad14 n=1 Tax=Lasiosphaeria miniovina TaxID=1954250 RepID=A0AA40B4Q8_9PEZI|nr:putative aryl-alcohol dehydrogenase Aad14 [Lasiosphaeria miniovina]KAK0727694.1 putative aryl-alcohol dehydrogenase Aad14 [Lasiosphaeria miniovina]